MIIKYIHMSDPKKEKFFDTEETYNSSRFLYAASTQEEFDRFHLTLFERDKRKGIILEYSVISENLIP